MNSKEYKFTPFKHSLEIEDVNNSKFCPVCGKNENWGHGHEGCTPPVTIESGYIGLFIVSIIYIVIKIKNKKEK